MAQREDNLIAVLDVGSAWTRVLVAEVIDGLPRYRGHGIVESAGMRRGLIAELGAATRAVRRASEQAEKVARLNIDHCVVGIGGPHIRGINTRGGLELGSRLRDITREDVRTVVDRARSIERPPDREFLHLLPRQFIVDGEPGVFDPVGMVGTRLEVDLHIATCSGSALQSAITCANKASLVVTDVILEPLAAAESTLSADERELGVALIDIGAHSTEIAVYFESAVAHTASVPIGGAHFTNDLAIGLQMPVALAEDLKRQYGSAVVTSVSEGAAIEIANPQPQRLELRAMAEILEPRARELLHYVKDRLREGGVENALGAGCVLTGGGAMLHGLLDVAESQLRAPARTGTPMRLSQMPGELAHPGFATAIGMLLYANRTRAMRSAEDRSFRARLRAAFASSY